VAGAIHVSPTYGTQSVATPGVAEKLVSTATYAISLAVFPKPDNTNTIYFGNSLVDKDSSTQIIIPPGSSGVSIDVPVGYKISVSDYFIDAIVANEGVNFIYLK
jgi:hypothetical protein